MFKKMGGSPSKKSGNRITFQRSMILYMRILELEEILKDVRVIFVMGIRDYKTH